MAAMNGNQPALQVDSFREDFDAIRREMSKIVVGQVEAIDGVLTALFAGGHVLLEGAPGVGKTLLAATLAEAVGLPVVRLPFTPDLMPADILGTYVIMETPQGRRTFEFQQGPLFNHVVLADHINRGTPKTQSALLEAMESPTVSVANEKFSLPQPFLVVATQNPQDMEGTFPLPEPELDRFLFKISMSPPSTAELDQILERTTGAGHASIRAVVDSRRIVEMQGVVKGVAVSADARRVAIALTTATHPQSGSAPEMVRRCVRYGSSPRGAQAMLLGAKVRALAAGRDQASAADVKSVVHAALRHRLILGFEGQAEEVRLDGLIDDLLKGV
jgi:MoxR-like ATPase